MNTLKSDLGRARAAYAECSWLEAYEAFARADETESLAPADLELRATTARMLARDDEAVEILERAHHAYLQRGETLRAAYCAGWIGMTLFFIGAVGPAGGWLARADRLLEDVPEETVVHGYALLPVMFRHEAAGDLEAAVAVAAKAAQIGKRHHDPELMARATSRRCARRSAGHRRTWSRSKPHRDGERARLERPRRERCPHDA